MTAYYIQYQYRVVLYGYATVYYTAIWVWAMYSMGVGNIS